MNKNYLSMRLQYLLSIILVSFMAIAFVHLESTSALSGSDWKAGNIVSNGVFTDTSTMTVAEIHNFLRDMVDDSDQVADGKYGQCDKWGSEPYAGTTRADYATNHPNGNSPPFTCLYQYWENPTTHANNYGDKPVPDGAKSAARIIKEAAERYDINPQILIVTLQKEQSLITDDWPWKIQYRSAMGYGCPDTADCDEDYYGFYNQVDSAAWQFRQYLNNPNNYNYPPGNRYVRYNPDSSCGGSTINILNSATSALYNYTPYQPNSAALNNLYGTGNSCSAYGNRNFWRYFNDWFGPSVRNYYSEKTDRCCHAEVFPGESYSVNLRFKNTGNLPWYDTTGVESAPSGIRPVMLYTGKPLVGHSSPFGSSWNSSQDVPAREFTTVYESDGVTLAANQHVVQPGQIAHYELEMTVPSNMKPGFYREFFQPSLFGRPSAFNDPHAFMNVYVLED